MIGARTVTTLTITSSRSDARCQVCFTDDLIILQCYNVLSSILDAILIPLFLERNRSALPHTFVTVVHGLLPVLAGFAILSRWVG